jgi:hypothetical protein
MKFICSGLLPWFQATSIEMGLKRAIFPAGIKQVVKIVLYVRKPGLIFECILEHGVA